MPCSTSPPARCAAPTPTAEVFHHFRTIDDDQIKALAQTGGVLGVNAIATMVSKQPTLDKLVDHISHIADLVGIDHVGLGLDFVKDDGPLYPEDEIFGVGENRLIPDFENEDDLPNITEWMIRRGFREDDIFKVLGGNFVRLLKAVLKPRASWTRSAFRREPTMTTAKPSHSRCGLVRLDAGARQSSEPITTVVGFAAGGFADTLARTVGGKLSERLGQNVIIENRAGAGGNIAAALVARRNRMARPSWSPRPASPSMRC